MSTARKIIKDIERLPHDAIVNLAPYYPINSQKEIQSFWDVYILQIKHVLAVYGYQMKNKQLLPDHFGLSVRNKEEFQACHKKLLKIADLLCAETINNRGCNIYKFKRAPVADRIAMPKIEIYAPVTGSSERELKVGIEHIAFKVKDYETFVKAWEKKKLPIAYEKRIGHSKFFKTPFINGILIEFRSDYLGEC